MYRTFFELTDKPFSIAPDPRFLFMSDRHREALAHLVFGIKSEGGFVLLTGEIGTGKTTVCRCLLEQLPKNSRVAFVINPRVTVSELLASICDEFGIECPEIHSGTKPYIDRLNRFLLESHAKGDNPVLIIDEAQNLEADVLEQVRLLTNLETNRKKLLQIIMLGQPELRDKLAQPELRQIEQRITARYHLEPLSRKETAAYIRHRLQVAGCRRDLFSARAFSAIHASSKGTPRLINILCDRSLLGAYAEGRPQAETRHVRQATVEVSGKTRQSFFSLPSFSRLSTLVLTTLLVSGIAIAATFYAFDDKPSAPLSQGKRVQTEQNHGETSSLSPLLDITTQELPGREPDKSKPQGSAQPATTGTPSIDEIPKTESIGKTPTQPASPVTEDSQDAVTPSTAAPAPKKKPSAGPATLEWPADYPIGLSQALAYQEVFQAWNIKYDYRAHPTPCQYAKANGLHCLYGKGSLETLRSLNRPAVLQLKDKNGTTYFAALTSLTENSATFALGSEVRTVSTGDISRRWAGSYILFWQMPPDYQGAVRPGNLISWMAWLEERLAKVGGRPVVDRQDKLLDGDLLQEIKAFQLRRNLVPDGIVGPFTLIHLNTEAGLGVPTLNAVSRSK